MFEQIGRKVELNWYGKIIAPNILRDYHDFQLNRTSGSLMLIINLSLTFILFPANILFTYWHCFPQIWPLDIIACALKLILCLVLISCGWIIYSYQHSKQHFLHKSTFFMLQRCFLWSCMIYQLIHIYHSSFLSTISSSYSLQTTLQQSTIGLFFEYFSTFNEISSHNQHLPLQFMNSNALDVLVYVLFLPLIAMFGLHISFIEDIYAIMGCNFIGLLVLIGYTQEYSLYPHLCLITILSYYFIYEIEQLRISVFFSYSKVKHMLQNNELTMEKTKAFEMRNMIGYVSHDLKTPLTSFATGLDIISGALKDCKEKMLTGVDSIKYYRENLQCISNCLEDFQSNNSLMLMTINRCIDYTKASKGMDLVPSIESVDLFDIINIPIHCMQNIQKRIEIILLPCKDPIKHLVFTDKQWLLENLLCLISNGVKYSNSGSVTIAVSMAEPVVTASRLSMKPYSGFRITKLNSIAPSEHTARDTSKDSHSLSRIIHPQIISHDEEENSDSQFPTLKTSTKEKAQYHIKFEVEDTGIGLSEDSMSNLFNPLKQTQRVMGGAGLGLYCLAKRIESLDGQFGVQQRRDGKQGSLFWFSIPYYPDNNSYRMTERYSNKEYHIEFEFSPTMHVQSSMGDLQIQNSQKSSALTRRTHGQIDLEPIVIDNTPTIHEHNALTSKKHIQTEHNDENNTYNSHNTTTSITAHTAHTATSHNTMTSQQSTAPTTTTSTPRPPRRVSMIEKKVLDILVVDDSPSILKMTSMLLKRQGMNPFVAENGQIALDMIDERFKSTGKVYDAVLMDIQMPVLDGLQATIRIRALEKESQQTTQIRPRQLIIGVSAATDHDATTNFITQGMDAFIPKPFSYDKFTTIYKEITVSATLNHSLSTANHQN